MKELEDYLADVHHGTTRLCELLEAIDYLTNENACEGGRQVMTGLAVQMCHEATTALDDVNLPKVAS